MDSQSNQAAWEAFLPPATTYTPSDNQLAQLQLPAMFPLASRQNVARKYAEGDWETQRPVITQLYEGNPLKNVMKFMKERHGLYATLKQYKGRIKKWGLEKNIKSQEMEAMIRKEEERRINSNKPSAFRLRKRHVNPGKDKNRDRDIDGNVDRIVDDSVGLMGISTPGDISCYTPTDTGPLTRHASQSSHAAASPQNLPYQTTPGISSSFDDLGSAFPSSPLVVQMTRNFHRSPLLPVPVTVRPALSISAPTEINKHALALPNLATDTEANPTIMEPFHVDSNSPSIPQMLGTHLSDYSFQTPMPFDMDTSFYPGDRLLGQSDVANSVASPGNSLFKDMNYICPSTGLLNMSSQSPRLIELPLLDPELNVQSTEGTVYQAQSLAKPVQFQFGVNLDNTTNDDVEEISQPHMSNNQLWMPQCNSYVDLVSMSGSWIPRTMREGNFNRLFRQPEVLVGSPEMLMLRFDKQTCGILSVKDGPSENPWRTLIWPLVHESPTLYHAIASMTAFHISREKPALRITGIEHIQRSIRSLAIDIQKMRTDIALATTLVLAYSEAWDQHISTGIEHLQGARILVAQGVANHRKKPLEGNDLARLRFLCNIWVYTDVIARLTSVDGGDSTDFDNILSLLNGSFDMQGPEIDPLMGCASTLFPLIGRAANLCGAVQKMDSNSIEIINQAVKLREQIEQWEIIVDVEDPEDPSCKALHAVNMAEAYRYATLLYLHQAVPEIPSLTSAQLSQLVFKHLAAVPLSSSVIIVQLYPLLAAGCEASDSRDREWVESRWLATTRRMWTGNVDKCWIVTREVWDRRDKAKTDQEAAKIALQSDGFTLPESCIDQMNPEMTVRGSLHWATVMKEWSWEVLLG